MLTSSPLEDRGQGAGTWLYDGDASKHRNNNHSDLHIQSRVHGTAQELFKEGEVEC